MYFFSNWINKLFSEENMVSRILFKARKVAGSTTYKQIKMVCDCVVSLFILCIQSWRQRQLVNVDKDLSILIKMSSSKLHTAPLGPLTKLLYWTRWGWRCVGPPPLLLVDYLWHRNAQLGSTDYRPWLIIRPISSFSSDYLLGAFSVRLPIK